MKKTTGNPPPSKSLKLSVQKNPLTRSNAKPGAKASLKVLLVDLELKARSAGMDVPTLAPSFRGGAGDRADLLLNGTRVVVIGCGKLLAAGDEGAFWEAAGAAAIDGLRALKIESAALSGALQPIGIDSAKAAHHFAIGATLASYRCMAYRKHAPRDHFEVKSLSLSASDWKASANGRDLGDAVNWARALTDAPANLLTPQTFAAEFQSLKALGVEVEILNVAELKRIGAGGLLAVGQGSVNAPCLVICRWQGRKGKGQDLGLVGKGLTFDAGGLNVKMPPGIAKMKFDMAGAAAVAGALRAIATRKTPVNVVAALPLCENLIDAAGYRPGDVITSLSGLTIEVDNTDAEGRIVLADAISYLINEYQPRLLVDLATLTGNMLASLHEEYAGFFTTDDALAVSLNEAGDRSNDTLWRMPLSKRQDYMVESEIADVKNVGAPGFFGVSSGSAIAGAKFLERFAGGTRWAHVDIAGTAWVTRPKTGIARGPTGFGVRLLDALADSLPG